MISCGLDGSLEELPVGENKELPVRVVLKRALSGAVVKQRIASQAGLLVHQTHRLLLEQINYV